MSKYQKNLGRLGENIAIKYLQNKRYKLLEKNYQTKVGEIDLVFVKNKNLIFVEVKTRTSDKYGPPQDAFNYYKQRKFIKTVQYYLLENCIRQPWQIDLVAIRLDLPHQKAKINHFSKVL